MPADDRCPVELVSPTPHVHLSLTHPAASSELECEWRIRAMATSITVRKSVRIFVILAKPGALLGRPC